MRVAFVGCFPGAWRRGSWHFQVASLHLQSSMDLSLSASHYFSSLSKRSGRRMPPAERSALYSSTNTSHSSSTLDIHARTTTRLRHTSSAAVCTDWSGRVQAYIRPALSQELSLRQRGGTMRWMWAIVRSCRRAPRIAVAVSLTEFDPAQLESRHDALDSPSTSTSGCSHRSLGIETASATYARRGGTCWEMVAEARF